MVSGMSHRRCTIRVGQAEGWVVVAGAAAIVAAAAAAGAIVAAAARLMTSRVLLLCATLWKGKTHEGVIKINLP
jgi:uncharacterized membrane protein